MNILTMFSIQTGTFQQTTISHTPEAWFSTAALCVLQLLLVSLGTKLYPPDQTDEYY